MERDGEDLVACLPPRAASAGVARELVTWQLRDWKVEALCEDAALVITELVTNAVRHARCDLELRMVHMDGGIRLEVSDCSPRWLVPRRAGPNDETGRGLQLVDALSDRYGVEPDGDGKRVWVEMNDRAAVG